MNIKQRVFVLDKGMQGLSFLIDFNKMNNKDVRALLSGKNDEILSCGFSLMFYGISRDNYDLENPEIQSYLNAFKNAIEQPKLYPEFFIPLEKVYDVQREVVHSKTRSTFLMKDMNAQHPMGTTKELSVKYGISIGDVRKHKAAGTLHELPLATA